ncbi:MAG: sulfite exporter TauE/SafE family protein [Alphaproteobacteria bacterium]|nr:MAG: sulfite exporter TauE/SafE family protein [Alphaproteobacteria bacterium]
MSTDPVALGLAALALGIGGVLKGATGAGTPVVAVPILAVIVDVPLAVSVMMVPNLLSNVVQAWQYRAKTLPGAFTWVFAGAGALGTIAGSVMLAGLPGEALMLTVGLVVFVYIGFRLTRPGWRLAFALARRLAFPVGLVAGILQGMSGISAPVSISFLNALGLSRGQFIATISVFFWVMTVTQVPALFAVGILTWHRMALSCLALLPIFAGMPLGALLARRLSARTFDRVMLALLGLIAVRLVWQALA